MSFDCLEKLKKSMCSLIAFGSCFLPLGLFLFTFADTPPAGHRSRCEKNDTHSQKHNQAHESKTESTPVLIVFVPACRNSFYGRRCPYFLSEALPGDARQEA